jgi:hypothetical protein
MGATNFGHLAVGRYKNASEAYNSLIEYALHDSGHNPYNGTISTTGGFKMRNDNPRYGTKAFGKWKNKMLDVAEKWGDCICIEIKGAILKRMKEARGYKGKKGIRVYYFFGWAAI